MDSAYLRIQSLHVAFWISERSPGMTSLRSTSAPWGASLVRTHRDGMRTGVRLRRSDQGGGTSLGQRGVTALEGEAYEAAAGCSKMQEIDPWRRCHWPITQAQPCRGRRCLHAKCDLHACAVDAFPVQILPFARRFARLKQMVATPATRISRWD